MFLLSAFADEYDSDIEQQLIGLRACGIGMIEPRGLFGKNVVDLTEAEAMTFCSMLKDADIGVSAIGSPIGKISIDAPIEPELDRLRRVAQTAHILGTERIRMFSFHMKPQDCEANRSATLSRMEKLVKVAKEEQVLLCHENEKGIYGNTAERNMDLWREMGGEIALVYDTANLIDIGQEAYPHAYEVMREAILYLHIKDSLGNCRFVPAGKGIGRIPELLAAVKRDFAGKEMILTLEPHLKVFAGMANLEQDMSKIKPEEVRYPDGHTAFRAAAEALKAILPA